MLVLETSCDNDTVAAADIQNLIQNWKDHPDLKPVVHFPSWIVPAENSIQATLHSAQTQPFRAGRLDLFEADVL
jgi:hypothetical protein